MAASNSPPFHGHYQQAAPQQHLPHPAQVEGYQPYPNNSPAGPPFQTFVPQMPPQMLQQQYAVQPAQPPQQRPYTFLWQRMDKHKRCLIPQGAAQPTHVIEHNTHLLSSGPEFTITSTIHQNSVVGTIKWHTWSGKIDISIASCGAMITYRDDFESQTGQGRLIWMIQTEQRDGATLKLADRADYTVATVVLTDNSEQARIEIWRQGMTQQSLDEVVVSAIAEIEDYRKKLNSGASGGVIAGGMSSGG
ncbi:hypothetical protein H2200_010077 [Cladophialophora chaetospira]|uniref:Uncharacterized protein n=1 Tax=Cladophialophora chaetospira TaxID=386627 RepID=A0AA39CEF3_9EURO|nr:hypothetical protein H2200_010077 [Cladophialophora chaetospira]